MPMAFTKYIKYLEKEVRTKIGMIKFPLLHLVKVPKNKKVKK